MIQVIIISVKVYAWHCPEALISFKLRHKEVGIYRREPSLYPLLCRGLGGSVVPRKRKHSCSRSQRSTLPSPLLVVIGSLWC